MTDRSEPSTPCPLIAGRTGASPGRERAVETSVPGQRVGSLLVNARCGRHVAPHRSVVGHDKEDAVEKMTLGGDVACRPAHQVSLADGRGNFVWSGRRFRTTTEDLEAL